MNEGWHIDPPSPTKGRLFLVGMGPSLKTTDFSKLIGEECWTTGRPMKLFEWYPDWRPTRHFVGDLICRPYHIDDVLFHLTQPYKTMIRWDVAELLNGLWDNKWSQIAQEEGKLPIDLGMRDHQIRHRIWNPELSDHPSAEPWDFCNHHNSAMLVRGDGSEDTRWPEFDYGDGLVTGWHLGWYKGPRLPHLGRDKSPEWDEWRKDFSSFDPTYSGSPQYWPKGWCESWGEHRGIKWCRYGMTMNVMAQMAWVEGYDPVYTIGTDLGFIYYEGEPGVMPDGHKNIDHYHEDYHHIWEAKNYCDRRDPTHECAWSHIRNSYDHTGRTIRNASSGGNLQALERVDFEELFGSQ